MTLPMTVTLGEVATFVRGITFKPEDVVPVETKKSVVCLRTKNVQAELDLRDVWAVDESFVRRADQFLQLGDILISSANSWNLVGKCSWVPELPWKASFGGFVSVLRADPRKVYPRFLYWWFSSTRIQALARSFGNKTTSISNLNIDRCLALSFELPCLEEQKRIASILDKLELLRVKRRESLVLHEDLAISIFIDMFGDPVENKKEWPRIALGELLADIESGNSPVCLDRPAQKLEWGVLKLGAITKCSYIPSENKALPIGVEPHRHLEVKSGDLLFSRKNTYALVAACAFVKETPPKLLMPDLIFRFRFHEKDVILPQFLHALLVFPSKRIEIQKLAGGSSGSMPNISKAKLRDTLIEVPPIELQREFVSRINRIDEIKKTLSSSFAQFDALFAALQHRAFRGEL